MERMRTLKFIGKLLLVIFVLSGVFAASMNRRRARKAAINNNERVTVEIIYKGEKSKSVFLITVDGEEYLYFQSFSSGAFVKK